MIRTFSLAICCVFLISCAEREPTTYQCADERVESCAEGCKGAPLRCEDSTACVSDCATDCPDSTDCGEPFCVYTNSDDNHCGACHQACDRNEECVSATCFCEDGYADCDPTRNGCETDILNDDDNCADCGFDCGDGYSCCDGRCRYIAGDPENCGSCDATCSSNDFCLAGTCIDL